MKLSPALALIFTSLFAFAPACPAFYDSTAGRWLNRDPIAENGGLNLYIYALNNPVVHIDPLGHAIVINNTGQPILVSGNVGLGHGTGSQSYGIVAPGATGGGKANPIIAYPTIGEAVYASSPDYLGPHRVSGQMTDVDFYDDPTDTTRCSRKLIGDELGPKVDLNRKAGGGVVPDQHNQTVLPAYFRRLGEKLFGP